MRCSLGVGGHDIYLNVAGGLRIAEPAADLAAAGAMISTVLGRPLPADCVIFGEIALSGAIRPVGQTDARLKEAAKLGFRCAIAPPGAKSDSLAVTNVATLGDLVERIRNSDV